MRKDSSNVQNFLDLLLPMQDKQRLLQLIDLFLTPEEKNDIEMRFLIIKELIAEKKTQRQIAKDLNVSIAKITRGSNELKRINPSLLLYLKENLVE